MTNARKPRKPMLPTLSDRDRAAIETTAKHSGLRPQQSEELLAPAPVAAPSTSEAPASDPPLTPAKMPAKQKPAIAPVLEHEKKQLRVSVSPSSDLAAAIREKIQALSPDAQEFVSTTRLLRQFLTEHDARLAQLFREMHGL